VSIQTLEGGSTTTADLVNEVPTVVSVWSVTCKACREELPALQELAADRSGEIAVLGVDNGDDAEDAQAYLDEIGVDIPMYLDRDGSLASAIGVSSLPATFIITPDGRIAWEHRGEVTRAQIEARLAELGV
jgi:cytochrome c biogenesis protein CcmG/thiol:disulfide interchange protein DsbE